MKYVVKIKKDGDGFVASFPDVPEALTGGDTLTETLKLAEDALLTAIDICMDQKKSVPIPKAVVQKGDRSVFLPEIVQAKVLLWNAMVKDKITKTELANRLGKTEGYVRKLLDPHQNITVNSLAEAAHALKKKIAMELVAA